MKVTIHRGSHEIGGFCLEIKTAQSLWVDFGLPLNDSLPQPNGTPDALLLTHCHPGHYGLMDRLPPYANAFQTFEAWKPFTIGDVQAMPYLAGHSAPEALLSCWRQRAKEFLSAEISARAELRRRFLPISVRIPLQKY